MCVELWMLFLKNCYYCSVTRQKMKFLEIPCHYNMSGNRSISGTSGNIDVDSFNTWNLKLP